MDASEQYAVETGDAVVAVLMRDGLVLVIERGPGVVMPGYWTPLSGRVRSRETQRSAVTREVREEVGLTAAPIAKVWECDMEGGSLRLHWWLASAEPGVMRLQRQEVAVARWIRPEDFSTLEPTFAADRHFFARILPGLEADGVMPSTP